jgi:putative NADH-flavin reductase
MRAAVLGAHGNLGRLVVAQAHTRAIETIAHDLHSYDPTPRLVGTLVHADVVVMVFPASITEPLGYPDQLRRVLDATREAGVDRVVGLIGSAGALTSHGERLVDTDYYLVRTRLFYQWVQAAWDFYRA